MEENAKVENKSFGQVIKESFKELGETFTAFVKAPRALWGIYVPYILEGLVYFGILTILGKFCSENLGLSDLHAGWVYSFLTGGITLSMLLLGGLSDVLGVRISLALSLIVMLAGRVLVAVSGTFDLGQGAWSPMFFMLLAGLLLVTVGYGLYQPAAYAGVKRYTTPETASMGYAVIYGFMNLGAFFSGFLSSGIRPEFEDVFKPNGLTGVFWAYVILTFLAVVASVLLLSKRADKKAIESIRKSAGKVDDEAEEKTEKKVEKEKINNKALSIVAGLAVLFIGLTLYSYITYGWTMGTIGGLVGVVITILGSGFEFFRKRPDHPLLDPRFFFFIFILIPVQTLFAHNWLTLPYYLDRAFAGSVVSEYFEFFSNLNPVLIFFLAPIVAGLTAKANVYKMMIYGTLVMALPTFLLAIGPSIWLFLTYVLLMTIGEAMWQPRFLQWIAEIAPEGKTGLYMGIGQLPWFVTKILTGVYAGYFVSMYIPQGADPSSMNSEFMWLMYSFIALVSPIGLILAKGWMTKGFKTANS